MDKEILSVNEAAEFLGIGRNSLYNAFKDGLKYVKIGRLTKVRRESLNEYVINKEIFHG